MEGQRRQGSGLSPEDLAKAAKRLCEIDARIKALDQKPQEELTVAERAERRNLRGLRRVLLSDPDPAVKCNAKNRAGLPCGNYAERGKTKCWMHGGAPRSGGFKGNRNPVTHGGHETIWLDQLERKEKKLAGKVTQDKKQALVEEIVLLTIRERRMLARIAALRDKDYTVIRKTTESSLGTELPNTKDKDQSRSVKINVEHRGTLGQIQTIEEHLTKVQDKKLRAIELLHKLETEGGAGAKPDIEKYVKALAGAAEDVWNGEDVEESGPPETTEDAGP